MEFGDLKISIHKLSLKITKIQILPVESPIFKGIFAALFPSSIVQNYEVSDEYPPSKISIQKLSIGLRIRSFVGRHDEWDSCNMLKRIAILTNQLFNTIFQLPIISIKLSGVTVEVEKAYIAPCPSEAEFCTTGRGGSFPSAVPLPSNDRVGPGIPRFDQDYILEFLKEDEIRDANGVTFWIERWIQHAVKEMEKVGAKNAANIKSDDERLNARIQTILRVILHSISIELTSASIVISGPGSDVVRNVRKEHDTRNTNILLAKLPKQRRALTIIAADTVTISVSPDRQCNLILCVVGAHIKVGNPLQSSTSKSEITYTWHTLVHPFDVALALEGLLSLLTWAVNYDHYWATRTLALDISMSEISISLSPEYMQTLMLHLDDYTDAMSSYNEYYCWLSRNHQSHILYGLDEDERKKYCHNYARIKGSKMHEDSSSDRNTETIPRLTASQMKELESEMTRYEILSLRCLAMRNGKTCIFHIYLFSNVYLKVPHILSHRNNKDGVYQRKVKSLNIF